MRQVGGLGAKSNKSYLSRKSGVQTIARRRNKSGEQGGEGTTFIIELALKGII